MDRPLAFAKAVGEVRDLGLERVHILKRSLGRLTVAGGQMIERVFRAEDLPDSPGMGPPPFPHN